MTGNNKITNDYNFIISNNGNLCHVKHFFSVFIFFIFIFFQTNLHSVTKSCVYVNNPMVGSISHRNPRQNFMIIAVHVANRVLRILLELIEVHTNWPEHPKSLKKKIIIFKIHFFDTLTLQYKVTYEL